MSQERVSTAEVQGLITQARVADVSVDRTAAVAERPRFGISTQNKERLLSIFSPILLLLLTGPGMWSEKWGWGALDRVESWFRRGSGRRSRQPARDLLDGAVDPDPVPRLNAGDSRPPGAARARRR